VSGAELGSCVILGVYNGFCCGLVGKGGPASLA
jgi:hypothetical protein